MLSWHACTVYPPFFGPGHVWVQPLFITLIKGKAFNSLSII